MTRQIYKGEEQDKREEISYRRGEREGFFDFLWQWTDFLADKTVLSLGQSRDRMTLEHIPRVLSSDDPMLLHLLHILGQLHVHWMIATELLCIGDVRDLDIHLSKYFDQFLLTVCLGRL
jgi:hypothetical protein